MNIHDGDDYSKIINPHSKKQFQIHTFQNVPFGNNKRNLLWNNIFKAFSEHWILFFNRFSNTSLYGTLQFGNASNFLLGPPNFNRCGSNGPCDDDATFKNLFLFFVTYFLNIFLINESQKIYIQTTLLHPP